MTAREHDYPYRPSWLGILCIVAFFGGVAVLMAGKALSNNRGLLINGLIHLSPGGATGFFWAVSGLGGVLALAGLVLAAKRLLCPQRVALTDNALIVPQSLWSSQERVIPFQEIVGLVVLAEGRMRFANVTSAEGKRYRIMESLLPSKAAFETVCGLLEERVSAVQRGPRNGGEALG